MSYLGRFTGLSLILLGLFFSPIRALSGEENSAQALTASKLQTVLQRLSHPDPKIRLQTVRAIQEFGKEAASTASSVADALLKANGATDENLVAAYLEAIRSMGPHASPVSTSISSLLKENASLYRNRDKHEVQRLRGYVLVVLTDIGIPKAALPQIVDWLANSNDDMGFQFGAAVRATASLGSAARPLTPYLLAGMQRYYHRDEFSLERYDPDYPRAEATTVQSEGIRALGRICDDSDPSVVKLLTSYANGTHPDTRRFPNLVEHANHSLQQITSKK